MQAGTARPHIKFLFALAMLLGGLALGHAARAQTQTGAQGWWLDATGRAGILVAACDNGKLCGRIEWLKEPLDAAGKPKTDIHNGDAALRDRPLCGLPMLGNFVPDGDGKWTGGWIYDPEAGKTYKSEMHLAADGTLHLRGYIGIPLLGRTTIWTRPAAPLPRCAGAAQSGAAQ